MTKNAQGSLTGSDPRRVLLGAHSHPAVALKPHSGALALVSLLGWTLIWSLSLSGQAAGAGTLCLPPTLQPQQLSHYLCSHWLLSGGQAIVQVQQLGVTRVSDLFSGPCACVSVGMSVGVSGSKCACPVFYQEAPGAHWGIWF